MSLQHAMIPRRQHGYAHRSVSPSGTVITLARQAQPSIGEITDLVAMRPAGDQHCRQIATAVDRNERYVVLRLNSARQRRVDGVSSSRRSSILTGWRMSAAESISARVRGQGKLDGSRSGADSSVAWAMTRRVPPGATRRGSMDRAVVRAVPWSGWTV